MDDRKRRNRRFRQSSTSLDRRTLMKLGLLAGGSVILSDRSTIPRILASSGDTSNDGTPRALYDPARQAFTRELFTPEVLQEYRLDPRPGGAVRRPRPPRGRFEDVAHGIAPEYDGRDGALHADDWNRFSDAPHEKEYKLVTEATEQEILPGVLTPIFAYRDANQRPGSGHTPGPTVVGRFREPVVIRNENTLTRQNNPHDHDIETSVHLHGSHVPSHADGYPDFYVLAGEARDYFYPNIAPRLDGSRDHGPFDPTWVPSTLWYHDHAMDITGFNVSHGLAGFYLLVDDLESGLGADGIIPEPGGPFDIGLAISDQRFNQDGTLFYDFLDHNGRLGDVFTVNGRAQPYVRVQRRKYRFRILNASNARFYQLRLSTRQPMLIFGTDSWLLPQAHPVESVELAMGQRHDMIIDFSSAPDEVYLENIMHQTDGRGARGVDAGKQHDLLLKFVVEGPVQRNDVTIAPGTVIRPHVAIRDDEAVAERELRFDRSNGAFTVNNRFFNPRRADAVPQLGTAERWTFTNKSGGWWHPIHSHLEGFQVKCLNGKLPPYERRFNSDLVNLNGGGVAEVLMKFRTFTGPFAIHCHNIEHEDMRMMATHDPRPAGETTRMDGEKRIDPNDSGVLPDCAELEAEGRIFFDEAGDLDRVEDRGVGFPDCEFDREGRGNQGR